MTRLYIAGPMTGLPLFNAPAFDSAERQLRTAGFDVLNPARRGSDPKMPWDWYMREALKDLMNSDAVALLRGWNHSPGARLEQYVAQQVKMRVHDLEDWLEWGDWTPGPLAIP